jgi:hypothetical protein
MIEIKYPLEESCTATTGADGVAAVVGVKSVDIGERWVIELTNVKLIGNCKFQTFRGADLVDGNQIDYTDWSVHDVSDTRIELRNRETISCKWTGDVGVVGTVVFAGSKFVADEGHEVTESCGGVC